MRTNQHTYMNGMKAVLVPYRKEHVPKYHGWMQSSELQHLTASEPLTLQQEYEMQQSWLEDENKCTFIVLDAEEYRQSNSEEASMVGDVNLFFNEPDEPSSAEIEIMIAESDAQGKGIGKEALCAMMHYGVTVLNICRITAKIGFSNAKSLSLFDKLGFTEISRSEVFEEVTLELAVTEGIRTWLDKQAENSTTETHAAQ